MSVTNQGDTNHGIYVSSSSFVVFEGTDYSSRDQGQDREFDRAETVSIIEGESGSIFPEIIFSRLTGEVGSPRSLMIANKQNQFTITINEQGHVDWE